MILKSLNLLNWKNIREAHFEFDDKLNCFIGLNGQGKTNVLDAIYMLSFTKSNFNAIDSQLITHDADLALVQGVYGDEAEGVTISCGLKRGQKKQFRRDKKDYTRLIDHIGLIPLVMISPEDQQLIAEGSDERRRFMDVVISQYNKPYLEQLTQYNHLLKQRNALLKQLADTEQPDTSLLAVFDEQMIPLAEYIYAEREKFIEAFVPIFQEIYTEIAGEQEQVTLRYMSQLSERDLREWYPKTLQRDLILGWTSQGIHKDEIEMHLGDYALKQVGSQGQQKTYLIAMKLAQAIFLALHPTPYTPHSKPILLLDDIFDKLDAERVNRIVNLLQSDRFGQIFITHTDTNTLTTNGALFHIHNGQVYTNEENK